MAVASSAGTPVLHPSIPHWPAVHEAGPRGEATCLPPRQQWPRLSTEAGPAGRRAGRRGRDTHLFSAGFTPTDREAMAVTVSASSFSHFWASTRECPTVEQRRGRERQYWPGGGGDRVTGLPRLKPDSSLAPLKPLFQEPEAREHQAHNSRDWLLGEAAGGAQSSPRHGRLECGGGAGRAGSQPDPRSRGGLGVRGTCGGPGRWLRVCLHMGFLSGEAGGNPASAQGRPANRTVSVTWVISRPWVAQATHCEFQ